MVNFKIRILFAEYILKLIQTKLNRVEKDNSYGSMEEKWIIILRYHTDPFSSFKD